VATEQGHIKIEQLVSTTEHGRAELAEYQLLNIG